MKLFGSTENKITKDKSAQQVPNLKISKVASAHCNIFNKDYQKTLKVLYTFVPNKPFFQLLNISPNIFVLRNL